MVFNDMCMGMFTGLQQPAASSVQQPESQSTPMFGGDIPAVHFNAVTPTQYPHFERMFYPTQTTAMWKSPTFTPVVGGRLNVQA